MGNFLQKIGALILYGGSLKLRPYERRCLESWIDSLPAQAQTIINVQMARLDLYKRRNHGKMLLFFPTGWPNGIPLPAEIRFPLQEDESRVAKIKVTIDGTPAIDCEVIVVLQSGQLRSLEFSEPPPAPEASATIQSIVHLREVLGIAGESPNSTRHAVLPADFNWLEGQQVTELKDPRPADEVRTFFSSFTVKLPDDYRRLLAVTNGFSIGRVSVYGVGDAWTAPRSDGEFVVIANIAGVGDIACKLGDTLGQAYLLDMENDHVAPLSLPFSRAIRELSLPSSRG